MSEYPLVVLIVGKDEVNITDEDHRTIREKLPGTELRFVRHDPKNNAELSRCCFQLKPDALVMWTQKEMKIILSPHHIGNLPSINME